jgi:hypothetical protein
MPTIGKPMRALWRQSQQLQGRAMMPEAKTAMAWERGGAMEDENGRRRKSTEKKKRERKRKVNLKLFFVFKRYLVLICYMKKEKTGEEKKCKFKIIFCI